MYQYEAYEDPIQRPRYTGLATFMRAPYQETYLIEATLQECPF